MTKSPKFKILFCYYQPHFLQPEQIGNTEFSTVQNGWHRLKSFKIHGIINTQKAGTLDFSGVPAFFVTMVLLVQCSAAIHAGFR